MVWASGRKPLGGLHMEVFQAWPAGKRPREERIGIPQSELVAMAWENKVWGPLLKLLPLRPDPEISVCRLDEIFISNFD